MGRIEESSEYRHLDHDNEETINAEVILPVASKVEEPPSSSYASELVENLIWTDTFYESEPDIVAVFDLDQDAIAQYQRNSFLSKALWAFLWLALAGLYICLLDIIAFSMMFAFLMFVFLFLLYLVLAGQEWKKFRAARTANIHLAITSVSVRYDQTDPMVSIEIPLCNISSCTIAQQKVRSLFVWCSPETTLNLVQLQIAGVVAPKVWIGLKDHPTSFARLVMMLKNNQAEVPQRSDSGNNHMIV